MMKIFIYIKTSFKKENLIRNLIILLIKNQLMDK